MQLNDAQKRAVAHRKGPLLIVAGAGAGKTRTLTERIIALIKDGVPPESILAITFTNKAAQEMRERIAARINSDPQLSFPISATASGMPLPTATTFHRLCVRILREFHERVGLSRHFSIADRDDALREVKRAMKALGYDPKQLAPRMVLSVISRHKNEGEDPTAARNDANPRTRAIAHIAARYQEQLAAQQLLDFDDLLVKAEYLLRTDAEVRAQLQRRYRYLHIDEYQDTNVIQFKLIRHLVGPERNIAVVGDVDQSIYTWRSARPEHMLEFETHFPDATTVGAGA